MIFFSFFLSFLDCQWFARRMCVQQTDEVEMHIINVRYRGHSSKCLHTNEIHNFCRFQCGKQNIGGPDDPIPYLSNAMQIFCDRNFLDKQFSDFQYMKCTCRNTEDNFDNSHIYTQKHICIYICRFAL